MTSQERIQYHTERALLAEKINDLSTFWREVRRATAATRELVDESRKAFKERELIND